MQLFLTVPADKIQNETFNVGYQNLSLMEIAELVRRVVGEEMPDRKAVDIVTTPTDDMRSYHINSDKIKRVLGYQPRTPSRMRCASSARRFSRGSCRTAWKTTATTTSVC